MKQSGVGNIRISKECLVFVGRGISIVELGIIMATHLDLTIQKLLQLLELGVHSSVVDRLEQPRALVDGVGGSDCDA